MTRDRRVNLKKHEERKRRKRIRELLAEADQACSDGDVQRAFGLADEVAMLRAGVI